MGSLLVDRLNAAGHEVVRISRTDGVDLLTGEGLSEALQGVTALIDVSQVATLGDPNPSVEISQAARNVVKAAEQAGVERVVMLSINGVQKQSLQEFPFYQARYDQENILLTCDVPTVVVRSTQWHEFALNPAAVEQTETEVKVQDWAVQPVPMAKVADFLMDAALGNQGQGIVTVTGPEQLRLPELTRRVLAEQGDARQVVEVPAALDALADGSLHAPDDAVVL